MQLNRPKNIFFVITFATSAFILLLGSWWLFLTFKLSNELEAMGLKTTNGNIINMVKWEGSVFFVLVLIITLAHLYMYASDRKKSQSINLFFASLTHELKTPLASIKLQSQVLSELLEDLTLSKEDHEKIEKYVTRLHESSFRLEHELDKHLQLSRAERDGVLNYKEIELVSLIHKIHKDFKKINLIVESEQEVIINADEFALSLIIRNLLENTQRHNHSEDKQVYIRIETIDKFVILKYKDNGNKFEGSIKKLGTLFYKHSSPKGSGLGLYMIRKLMQKMAGRVKFTSLDSLNITLTFKKHDK